MSDIVDMLRTPTGACPPTKWELAAADEIERLRREIVRLKEKQDVVPDGRYFGRKRR